MFCLGLRYIIPFLKKLVNESQYDTWFKSNLLWVQPWSLTRLFNYYYSYKKTLRPHQLEEIGQSMIRLAWNRGVLKRFPNEIKGMIDPYIESLLGTVGIGQWFVRRLSPFSPFPGKFSCNCFRAKSPLRRRHRKELNNSVKKAYYGLTTFGIFDSGVLSLWYIPSPLSSRRSAS